MRFAKVLRVGILLLIGAAFVTGCNPPYDNFLHSSPSQVSAK